MWLNGFFPWFTAENCGIGKEKRMAKYENNIEFQNVFCNLLNLAVNSFSFKGMPASCNERYFKLMLIFNGYAALINDKELGYLSLGVRPMSFKYNMYGDVSDLQAFGWNGFNRRYSNYMIGTDNRDADAVVCKDNAICYPLINVIMLYAKRLSNTMRTLDVTAKKLKTPYFITCDESQKSSVKKILDDVDFNVDNIICNKSTMPNEFNVLQTGVNGQNLDSLWAHYHALQGEIRTLLGINNTVNLNKKERLITSEADANDILTDLNLDYRMVRYKEFCDIVNDLWGMNISVVNNIARVEDENDEKENTDKDIIEEDVKDETDA